MATQFASIVNNRNYSGNLTYIGSYDLLSQDPIANTSSIRLYGSVYNRNSYASYGSDWGVFKLDGTTIYDDSYRFYYGTTSLGTKDIVVAHNADGSFPARSVDLYADSYHFNEQSTSGTISGIPSIDRNGASVTLAASNITANGFTLSATTNQNCNKWEYRIGTSGSWTTFSTTDGKSASVALTGLNPAVSYTVYVRVTRTYNNVQSTSSVSATTLGYATIDSIANINTGSSAVVKFTPKATGFYYKVDFKLNGTTLATETIGNVAQTSQYSYTTAYKFPVTLLPNSTSATITATLYTYTNSGYNVLVGTGQTKTFTLTVPSSVVPSISTEVTPYNTNPWLNSKGIYVSGYTQIKIVASPIAGAGANVSSVAVTGQSIDSQNDNTFYTSVLYGAGSKSVTTTVTDSRGRTASRTDYVTYLPYAAPAVNAMSAQRGTYSNGTWTSDENGNHIRVTASATGSLSSQGNTLTLKLTAKIDGIDTPPTAQSGNDYYWTGTTADQSYVVTAEVTDLVGNTSTSFITVSSVSVPFNLNTLMPAAAFGKVAEIAKALELASDWRLVANGKYNQMAYMPYSWTAGNTGVAGYARIATISFQVSNERILSYELEVMRRFNPVPCHLNLLFGGTSATDPPLNAIYKDNADWEAFAYKRGTGIWDIYVAKPDYTEYFVVKNNSPEWLQNHATVTIADDTQSTIPSGAVIATQLPIVNTAKYNTINYLPYSFNAIGTSGSQGYARIATVTVTGSTWTQQAIHFHGIRRTDDTPFDLYFSLYGAATDPPLHAFYAEFPVSAGTNPFEAFAYKVADYTWDLYVRKCTGSDQITIWADVPKCAQDGYTITYSHGHQTSVPSGAVMATHLPNLKPTADTYVVRTSGASRVNTLRFTRDGNVCNLYINIKTDGNTASGANIFIGTVNAPKPPQYITATDYVGSTSIVAGISGGKLYVRNTTPNTIPAGTSISFSFVYITDE